MEDIIDVDAAINISRSVWMQGLKPEKIPVRKVNVRARVCETGLFWISFSFLYVLNGSNLHEQSCLPACPHAGSTVLFKNVFSRNPGASDHQKVTRFVASRFFLPWHPEVTDKFPWIFDLQTFSVAYFNATEEERGLPCWCWLMHIIPTPTEFHNSFIFWTPPSERIP